MKTVLVDADSRQRSISKMFGFHGVPGLVELVNGSASHDECLQRAENVPIDFVASSADSCSDILTNSASEIFQALQAYLDSCDLLIVDLPAASEPDQVVALAQHLDCVVVVIESEKTQTVAADRLLRRLSESNTEVIGVVLNKTHSYIPKVLQKLIAPQSVES
jgi:Mrp family chromosome partitioning ATPase